MQRIWRSLAAVGLSLSLILSSCNSLQLQEPKQTPLPVSVVQGAAAELEEALAKDGIGVDWSHAELETINDEIQLLRVPTSKDAVKLQAILMHGKLTGLLVTDIVDPETNKIAVGDYFTGRVSTFQVQLHLGTKTNVSDVAEAAPKTTEISINPLTFNARETFRLIRNHQVGALHTYPGIDVALLSTDCDHLQDHIEDAQRDVNTAAGWLAAALVAWEAAKVAAAWSCVVPGPGCVAALAALAGASAAVAAATYAYNNAQASLESAREAYAAAGCP